MKGKVDNITIELSKKEAICLFEIISTLNGIDNKLIDLKEKFYNQINSFYSQKGILHDYFNKEEYYVQYDGYYLQINRKTNAPELTCIIINVSHEIDKMHTFFLSETHDKAIIEFKKLVEALKILRITPFHLGQIFEAIKISKN